jgi:hypothetical protein
MELNRRTLVPHHVCCQSGSKLVRGSEPQRRSSAPANVSRRQHCAIAIHGQEFDISGRSISPVERRYLVVLPSVEAEEPDSPFDAILSSRLPGSPNDARVRKARQS